MVSSFSSHESKAHHNVTVEAPDPQGGGTNQEAAKENFLFNYHQAKLAFGLVLFEFGDAIKAGDGERLHDFNKVALLLYKAHGKTKYACHSTVPSQT